MVALKLENISKCYGQTQVIDNVSCLVEHGELMVLVGPSGCGKTTLLKIILGDVQPDTGSIYVDGKLINHVPIENRNIGFVPQDFGLFPHLTVYENIGYGLKVRKIPDKQLSAQVNDLMQMLKLDELETRTPDQLSWGQQQRVALARALAIAPALLLLDEPLSAVDWSTRLAIAKHIEALQQRLKITTLYVTHDIDEALDLGHRVMVMNCGNLEQCDTPENLIKNPRTLFIERFIRRLHA
jgi:ABC-type Fe3+/spermidine/putrescine transport system ATPase subunit